jgi:hypothetical protein
MDGSMNGYLDGWMNGWMNGWNEEGIEVIEGKGNQCLKDRKSRETALLPFLL